MLKRLWNVLTLTLALCTLCKPLCSHDDFQTRTLLICKLKNQSSRLQQNMSYEHLTQVSC